MKEMIKEIIREEMMREQKKFCFMAGLPRSGSTLLSAILNQNPKIYSGPSSPVTGLMVAVEEMLASDELFKAYPKKEQAGEIIANIIKHFYSDVQKPVIIDKNRSWVNRLHYIPGYFGIPAKVLCPVRNIDEIFASFIALRHRNPFEVNGKINFIDGMLVKTNTPLNDDNRCEFLASEYGIFGQSYNGHKQAIMTGHQKELHFIEYDDLINNPQETMRKIYDFLEEEYFEHDFSNVINIHKEKDSEVYGITDMHDVRKQVSKTSIDPKEILSEAVLKKCEGLEFWRNLKEIDLEQIQQNEKGEPNGNV